MDVFRGWENHTERIKANWNRLITYDDTVVLAGDTSWALKLEETLEDFKFVNSLKGKKLILKGNHDFWWTTQRKIQSFFLAVFEWQKRTRGAEIPLPVGEIRSVRRRRCAGPGRS